MSAQDQARTLTRGRNDPDASLLLEDLESQVERATKSLDLTLLDQLIARVAGVRRRCSRMGAPADVDAMLSAMVDALERRAAHLAFELATPASERRQTNFRARVLAALGTPRRPVEIALELGIDPANVARALRDLRASGDVTDVPALGGDRRARAYVATADLDLEIARARRYLDALIASKPARLRRPPDSEL